jgi:uncharacterized protein (TIGR03000 family)
MYARFITRKIGAVFVVAVLLSAVQPIQAQEQGWLISHPPGSSSFPWNAADYRGYHEPFYSTQKIAISAPSTQPQKYELNSSALPMMKNIEDANAITLVAHVPENAQIWFDDKTTNSKGKTRTFYYPNLVRGWKYSYTVRVAWIENDKVVSQAQTLTFVPGDVQCIHLTKTGSLQVGPMDTIETKK